jgi:23S rRNA pseudouridine1911/1915/1917 synthase
VLVVDAPQQFRRLDQFVAAALAPERSRSQVGKMIKSGLITVNGTAVRASCAIRPGDRIEVACPNDGHSKTASCTENSNVVGGGQLDILFCDSELIAVNKPAGMAAHPSAGHPDSTLADALMARFPDLWVMAEPDAPMRAGIVHRLDKETSGVMVVARTPFARMALSRQFKDRGVKKVYIALVQGIVGRDRFTVDRPLGRHPIERKRMSIRSRKPREARTEFIVLNRFQDSANSVTLLKAQPLTGRTHQIRVHLAASGHPCLGDLLYGRGAVNPAWPRAGQALHALALTIRHPRTGEQLEFLASLPEDLTEFLITGGLQLEPSSIRQWIDAQ